MNYCAYMLIIFLVLECFASVVDANGKTMRIGVLLPFTDEVSNTAFFAGPVGAAITVMAMNELKTSLKRDYNVTLKYAIQDTRQRFGKTAEATTWLATASLGKTVIKPAIHGLIGARDNTMTKAAAYVCNDYNLAQVSYGANGAELGSGYLFPNFVRVFPSDGFEAYAQADLIGKTFGWTRVVVVYTTDIYGSFAQQVFQYRAHQLGVKIVAQIQITPGQAVNNETVAALQAQINEVKALDGRIWAILSDDITQVKRFFYMAQSILSRNAFFIGNSWTSTPQLFKDTGLSYDVLDRIMKGYIGTQVPTYDWMRTPIGLDLIARLRKMNATAWVDPKTSGIICSNDTDDSGIQKIYQVYKADGKLVCNGMVDYSTLHANGSNVSPLAAYLYDSIYLMVNGIVEYCRTTFPDKDGSFYIPPYIDGKAVAAAMVNKIRFNGTSGLVKLATGISAVANYGFGDRQEGIRFAVVNYHNDGSGTIAGMSLKRIGSWVQDQGLINCTGDYITHSKLTGGCYDLLWSTMGNIKPPDRADPVTEIMSTPHKHFIMAFAVIVFCCALFIGAIIIAYRKTRLLKASQVPMLWIILTGLMFGAARIAVASVDTSTSSCISRYWMGHLAFTTVAAMLAKTLRVHLIVNAKAMKKVKITSEQVMGFTAALIFVIIVLMTFITPLNKLSAAWYIREAITGQYTFVYYCQSQNPGIDWILYTYEMVIIVASAKLCYDTRNVPDAVNEAPAIAKVIFIITGVSTVAFSLVFVIDVNPWVDEVITAVAFFVSCMAVVAYYFTPKVYLLLTGADLDGNFRIVYKGLTEQQVRARKSSVAKKIFASTMNDNQEQELEKGKNAGGKVQNQGEKAEGPFEPTGKAGNCNLPAENNNNNKNNGGTASQPKTIEECLVMIKALETRMMVLAQRATQDSHTNFDSGSDSVSLSGRAGVPSRATSEQVKFETNP